MEKLNSMIRALDGDLSKYESILASINHYRKAKEIVERTHIAMGRKSTVDFSKTQVTNIKTNVKSTARGTTGATTKV